LFYYSASGLATISCAYTARHINDYFVCTTDKGD